MDRRASFETFNFYRYAVLMLVSGLVLIPLAATVLGGFKTLGDLLSHCDVFFNIADKNVRHSASLR